MNPRSVTSCHPQPPNLPHICLSYWEEVRTMIAHKMMPYDDDDDDDDDDDHNDENAGSTTKKLPSTAA